MSAVWIILLFVVRISLFLNNGIAKEIVAGISKKVKKDALLLYVSKLILNISRIKIIIKN